MSARITALYRYPVKGFSPQPLDTVDLVSGETMPWDRAFAIENGPSGFDPATPTHVSKMRFYCLARVAGLARYATTFDPETTRFAVKEDGTTVAEGRLDAPEGRAAIEAFVTSRFEGGIFATPKVLRAPGHSFSDVAKKVLHLVNLETLRHMEAELGTAVDPIRFRPNIVVEGLAPHAELDWAPGTRIMLGNLPFEMVKRTERCAATTVEPTTGLRDLQIPKFLMKTLGHTDCGVYLRSLADGRLGVGDPLAL